jgi:hypothetical protein
MPTHVFAAPRRTLSRVAFVSGLAFVSVTLAPISAHAASDTPSINVSLPSEVEQLAKGYEEAFRSISDGPLFLSFRAPDGSVRVLSGLRGLRASGGVLIVTTDRGPVLVVSARDVLLLTNERPGA